MDLTKYKFLYRIEVSYTLNKTLFVNKGSTLFNFFSIYKFSSFSGNLFKPMSYSTLVNYFIGFFAKVRKYYRDLKQSLDPAFKTYDSYCYFYSPGSYLTNDSFFEVYLSNIFPLAVLFDANFRVFSNLQMFKERLGCYNKPVVFYKQNFLYRNNLMFKGLTDNFVMFLLNLKQKHLYSNFGFKNFFDFNTNLQKIVTYSFKDINSYQDKGLLSFSNFFLQKKLLLRLNLIFKNYKYLCFVNKSFVFDNFFKNRLILNFYKKVYLLFEKYGVKKNFNYFLSKLKYIFFMRKNYQLFFKKKKARKIFFLEKFNGFFKPLLKQYYKRYGRRYKRRCRGRIRMWHIFFLRNRKRKKKKKKIILGRRKRYESWLIKTKKFIYLRKQLFHKQIIKYVFLNNIDIFQFKGHFKINSLPKLFLWNTFRLKVRRYGPNNIVKNVVRYNKYNLMNNLYLKKKLVKGRLANFFWRKPKYLKKNFFSNIERSYKRLINFALDCLAPVGFMGAFRVKRQKKVLKRSFITKNYRRYFLGAKLLISLAKKNKRMADVEKLAFRIWHLWRFINCGKKPKYFKDALQKYYKPFAGVKSNQRFWKWRYVSDRGTIFKYFYW